MNGRGFDVWTSGWSTDASRRAAGRTLLATGLATLLAARGGEEAVAACKKVGKPCDKDRQCCNRRCRHGKCRAGGLGTCPAGLDFCAGTFTGSCNHNPGCNCFTTTAGETRCGDGRPGGCGACSTDADCAEFGAHAFCAQDTGEGCGCATGEGFCVFACPS